MISIITPLFNKQRYIGTTIESVLAQTEKNWEMVVVDNGSSDAGPEMVRGIARTDARIRLVQLPRQGPGAARNFGLAQAAGEWVVFLDADDLFEPDFLELQLDCSAQHPEADLIVSCQQEFNDGEPNKRILKRPPGWGGDLRHLMDLAIACAPWSPHTVLIRRAFLGDSLLWPEEFDQWPSEDSAFWFPVLLKARLAWSASAGALYRTHTPSSRNETPSITPWIHGLCKIIDRNVAALADCGKVPSRGQCKNIIRMLEEKYWIARRVGEKQPAHMALEKAERWLRQCPADSPSLLAKKLLGIGNAMFVGKVFRALISPVWR